MTQVTTNSAILQGTAEMSPAETKKALALANALLRDALMYVGSKACSGGLTGEINKFLQAHVPTEQLAAPAMPVYTSGPGQLDSYGYAAA